METQLCLLQRGIQNDLGISYRVQGRTHQKPERRNVPRGVMWMCPHPPWGDLLENHPSSGFPRKGH